MNGVVPSALRRCEAAISSTGACFTQGGSVEKPRLALIPAQTRMLSGTLTFAEAPVAALSVRVILRRLLRPGVSPARTLRSRAR